MRFALTDEQHQLASVVRALLTIRPPSGDLDRDLLVALGDMDVLGLGTPDSPGGMVELAVVAEEVGAALPGVPFTATSVGALMLADQPEILAPVIAGTTVLTVAWQTFPEPFGMAPLSVTDGAVSGRVTVPFGAAADLLVAFVPTGVVLVDLAGAHREPVESFDLSEPLATITLDAVRPVLALPTPNVLPAILTTLAAELVGTGARALDGAVRYAKQREQFGRPIGSFQAIKHMLADRHVQLDAARSLVHYAAWQVDDSDEDELPARTALAAASDAATAATADSLQAHGGIGFTWEHPAHRYLRRARARRSLVGTRARQYDRIAEHILGLV